MLKKLISVIKKEGIQIRVLDQPYWHSYYDLDRPIIYIGTKDTDKNKQIHILLHEYGHFIDQRRNNLTRRGYVRDMMAAEKRAWRYARIVSRKLGFKVNNDIVKEALSAYAD